MISTKLNGTAAVSQQDCKLKKKNWKNIILLTSLHFPRCILKQQEIKTYYRQLLPTMRSAHAIFYLYNVQLSKAVCFAVATTNKTPFLKNSSVETKTLRYEFNLHYNLSLLLTNYCRFGSSCFLLCFRRRQHLLPKRQ